MLCFGIVYQVLYTVSGSHPFLRVLALREDVFAFGVLQFLQSLVVFGTVAAVEQFGGGIHPQLGTQCFGHYDGGAYHFIGVEIVCTVCV